MRAGNVCPVCASTNISVFFEITGVPAHVGLQWSSQDAARNCPKGDIKLAFCYDCSLITNLVFEPACLEYSQAYDNSLCFSHFFQEYAHASATRLIERYNLHHKDIIEIGCGQGEFLLLLCELGNNRGVGFDLSLGSQRIDPDSTGQITFIQDFYSERYASYQADLICCRQVFEHIHSPKEFLSMVRRTIGDRVNTAVSFEVPNVLFILRSLSIWDIIYEHCSYFSSESLVRVFSLCGFDIYEITETYAGQFLSLEALPAKGDTGSGRHQKNDFKEITRDITVFADNYRRRIETWYGNFKQMAQRGQRPVVWGAGARGISFLNMLQIQNQIEYVVDINPRKQGLYIAGTGQQIVSPEFLRDYRPDVIIVMNPIYKEEIYRQTVQLGLNAELLCA